MLTYISFNFLLSTCAFFFTKHIIPKLREMFYKANLVGKDVNKTNSREVPEALGVVSGCIFLIVMFMFIPVAFSKIIIQHENFPHNELVEMISALLSICCMLLLGFADDVLDLRWRHKLLLPTIASLPLLVVYHVNFNSTTVIVPKLLRNWFGYSVDLGYLYYGYMGMLAVFCTNAINILAGINGLEVGQSVVIATSIAIFNLIELRGDQYKAHLFSIQFMMPYIATSLALLKHNWYPAEVFVGDTFCYFSGMTFAVVGILGHFSKTMLLFFIPQIFNFVYSLLQLFKFVDCPRHRMPRLNRETGNLEMSLAKLKRRDLRPEIVGILRYLSHIKVIYLEEDGDKMVINNMTLINLILFWSGPLHEAKLTTRLMIIQIACSCLAFVIRFPLAYLFYDVTW